MSIVNFNRYPHAVFHLFIEGYKPSAAKTADEYASLDAEDESLARWKASLGIVPGSTTAAAAGPKACSILVPWLLLCSCLIKVSVLTLELVSSTLPEGKTIVLDLNDAAAVADTKKNPIVIKEGVEYK